jgi:hypothetical protein
LKNAEELKKKLNNNNNKEVNLKGKTKRIRTCFVQPVVGSFLYD